MYATSPERIVEPYSHYIDGEHLGSHANKGFSGVKGRSADKGGRGMEAIELRTSELWGTESMGGLQRYLNSGEAIGSMLMSYQKMPMEMRDQIIGLEREGKLVEAREVVEKFSGYDLENDQELALSWWDLRKQFVELFGKHGVPDPSTEYWDTEFRGFSKVLAREEKKMMNGNSDNMITKARALVINARAKAQDLTH